MSDTKDILDHIESLDIEDDLFPDDVEIINESIFEYTFPEENQKLVFDGSIWICESFDPEEDDIIILKSEEYDIFEMFESDQVELFNGFMLDKNLFEEIQGYVDL